MLSVSGTLAQTNTFLTWDECLVRTKTYSPDLVSARAAVRDVARVMEIPLAEADKLAKLIPEQLGMTLDQALEWIASDELVEVTPSGVRVRKVILDAEERKKAERRLVSVG